MADRKREAHPRHNDQEYLVAAIAGIGLTLMVVSAFLAASGLTDDISGLEFSNVALIGGALIFVAIAMWLAWLRPWTEFDDLKTAYYTGHHDHHHDETHEDVVIEAAKKNDEFVTLPVTDPSAAGITEIRVAPVAAMEGAGHEPELALTEIQAEPALHPDTMPAESVTPIDIETTDVPSHVTAEVQVVDDKPDDLAILEGIGPKTQQALYAEGITKFSQVAAMTPAELEHIVKTKHGVRIVGSTTTWPRQARLAAAGDRAALDELKKRVRKGYLYDDFTDIEGIGPVIQEALYEAGIRCYEDLAAADIDTLKKVANDPKVKPESWAKQAKLLADGDLTGLQEYQDRLRSGRE